MWEAASGKDPPARWLRSQISDRQKLVIILKAFRDTSQTLDRTDRLRIDLISRYIDLDTLEQIIVQAVKKVSREETRVLLNKCLAELHDYWDQTTT